MLAIMSPMNDKQFWNSSHMALILFTTRARPCTYSTNKVEIVLHQSGIICAPFMMTVDSMCPHTIHHNISTYTGNENLLNADPLGIEERINV